jgi:4-hydroxybenzoate polyprenyltransferase
MAGRWGGAALSTAALALVIAAGYAVNDACDLAADRVNAPWRPVPAGRVSSRAAAVWGAALAAAGLALGALGPWPFAATLAAVAAGLLGYDLFSKRVGPVKPILVAALMTSIYPLAFAAAGGIHGSRAGSLAAFPVWMFLTAFGYEVLKDLRDAPGDRSVVPAPAPVHRRPHLWRGIASAAIVAGAAVLVAPAFLGCHGVYMVVASLAILSALGSVFLSTRLAIAMVYGECFLVGVAATADVLAFGF